MADRNLELLLRIIAQVDGLRDVEGLREQVEQLDPALSGLADRARAALTPMDGLASSARNFGASVKEATQPLADMAETALKVSSIAAALAAALGGAVYQEAKKFESAQLDLKKVLGGTQEELDIYGQKLNALALEFGVSSNALTASMASFAQAGFSADEALHLVTQSLKLKVAGDLEAGQASDYLVRILKGFGAQAADSARFVDVLNEVSNRYATDVRQLAEGMGRVAPIAEQMGLSFEETAGILTPMIEAFGSGAEAAEAFKTGALKLIDDAAPVQAALQNIGVAQRDLNWNLRSGKDILNDVMVAFQTTADSQKLLLTQQLVGIDQAPRLIKVFDNLNTILGAQQAGLDAAGSAQQEVNIRLQSAETIGNRTAESFRQLAVALGTNFRGEVKGVVDATGALARAFLEAEQAGSMDGLFAAVKPQLESVENLFRKMAENLPAAFAQLNFSPLTSAIADLGGEVGQAFAALMGNIDLTTVDGLRQAMQLIADSMAALIRFTAGAVDQMEPFFTALGKAARFAAENADSISRLAGEVSGFRLTVNQLIPLLADFAAGTFSIIGNITEAAFKVGLLVGAVKLLNLAGIEVLPLLGRLALAIGSLNLSTATAAAAFAGFPGVLLGLSAAAGAAAYATGTLLSKGLDAAAESITGTSFGGLIYELAEALGLENTEAQRAAVQQEQLAKARARQAAAAQLAAQAAREKQLADEREAKAAEVATKNALAADEANRKLAAGFQASGLIWNQATGELVRVKDALAGTAPASLDVQNALRTLGVNYAALSGAVGEGSEKIVTSFIRITKDVTANAPIIAAALQAAVNKAETVGDLDAIEAAFKKYAETGKLSASEIAQAQRILSQRFIELRQAQDPAIQSMSAVAKEASNYVDATERLVDAQTAGIRAEIALAQAKGDTAAVQRLTRELALAEADGAVRVARAKEAEQVAEYAVAVAKRNKIKVMVENKEATEADLALAELTVQKELAEAIAAGTNTKAQVVLAQALRDVNGAKAGATEGTQQNTQNTQQNTEATKQNANASREGGAVLKSLIDVYVGVRAGMSKLSEAAARYYDVQYALRQELFQMNSASSSVQTIQNVSNAMAALAATSDKAGSEMAGFRKELADAQATIRQGEAAFARATNSFAMSSANMAIAAGKTREEFYRQKIEITLLKQQIEEMGTAGLRSGNSVRGAMEKLREETENAGTSFNLLAEQDLNQLNESIDEAIGKLEDFSEEAVDAATRLAQLDEELAREQGDDQRADLIRQQIDYEQQLAEIQRNLQAAESAHNQELIQLYQQQMARLNEINDLRIRNIEEENKPKPTPKPGADAKPGSSTNQQESDRRQIAQQNQTTDALAEGAARRNQVMAAMAQAAREAAAANATASQSIIQSNRALASALAEEARGAVANVRTIYSDLAAAVAQEQAAAGAALLQLEKDNADAIVAANLAKGNALAAAEEENEDRIEEIHQEALDAALAAEEEHEDKIADIRREAQAERAELDADYQQEQEQIAERMHSSILQINQDTASGIADAYAQSHEEIAKIQQEFSERVQALNEQFATQALDSGASLAQRAEALRRQLLAQTGEQGLAANAEFGDQISELAQMYASAGEGAQDNFNAAIERARQLNAIQLQGLLDSGKITQEQYAAAQAEAARIVAQSAQQVEQERARLAAEQDAKRVALEQERDQQIAAAQAVADAKKRALEEEERIKKENLFAEATSAYAALEEETANRLAAIDAEEAARIAKQNKLNAAALEAIDVEAVAALRAQDTAHAAALAKIDAEAAAAALALAAEYEKRQQAAADALAQKLADLQTEADARAAQIATESAARRAQLQAEHDQAIQNIQAEHAARIQAIREQAAEVAKPPPKPADPEPKPATPKPVGGSLPTPGAGGVFTLNLTMGSKTLTATTNQNPAEFLSAVQIAQRSAM